MVLSHVTYRRSHSPTQPSHKLGVQWVDLGTKLVDQKSKKNLSVVKYITSVRGRNGQERKVRKEGRREEKEDEGGGLRGSLGGRYLYGEGVTGDKAGVELVNSPFENLVH